MGSDREIISRRSFPAPPEDVFAAFGDVTQLAQWWGPRGFTNTFEEFDLRPGGRWRSIMHGPDGTDYPIAKRFVDVAGPGRVAFRHEQDGHGFVMTMTFAPEHPGTSLTWSMVFDSADECERVRDFVIEANRQNLERLAAHLDKNRRTGCPPAGGSSVD